MKHPPLRLAMLKNFKKLVATVQIFSNTSKKMAASLTAWHSGWFGCWFGFGAYEPRHFLAPPVPTASKGLRKWFGGSTVSSTFCFNFSCRRARPSKRARTSGPRESSTSCPEPSPAPTEESASPHLSPASRIRRPLFTGTPIPGNVDLRARDFHQESFYDVPALTADPRFRDSMRLITQYSLLPFMTPQQFYYLWVVLQFYHSMTSQGVPSQMELRFTIDDRPRVLRAANISAALGLPAELANSRGYRD